MVIVGAVVGDIGEQEIYLYVIDVIVVTVVLGITTGMRIGIYATVIAVIKAYGTYFIIITCANLAVTAISNLEEELGVHGVIGL